MAQPPRQLRTGSSSPTMARRTAARSHRLTEHDHNRDEDAPDESADDEPTRPDESDGDEPTIPDWVRRAPLLPAAVVGSALLLLALFGGAALALTLGALVVWHEVGHVQAARRLGLPTGPYAFVPFTRRVLAPASFGRTRAERVAVALGGPLYGLHLCVPALAIAFLAGGAGLRGVIALWALLNLVNLLPLHPFDGGRIVHELASSFHPFAGILVTGVGTAALAAVALALGHPLLLIVGALSVFELLREYERHSRQKRVATEVGEALVKALRTSGVVEPAAEAGFAERQVATFVALWSALLLFYAATFFVALYAVGLGAPIEFGIMGAP